MRISEASRISGVSARSLRYYEDEGLIVPGRFDNGYRDYCRSTVDRVLAIRALLESGLPVRLIKQVLPHLTDDGRGGGRDRGRDRGRDDDGSGPLCAEFLREVHSYRDRLTARIADLSAQRSALDAYLRQVSAPGPSH